MDIRRQARWLATLLLTLAVSQDAVGEFEKPGELEVEGEATSALVCWLRGEVLARSPEAEQAVRLELFDHLKLDTLVQTGVDAELILVFADGRRFAVEPHSRVRIGHHDAEAEAGAIKRLEPVPTMAILPRLSPAARPGERPGATRIRHPEDLPWSLALTPGSGATVLADATVLRFTPLPGIDRYKVEVSDLSGTPLFAASVDASEPSVMVPPELIRPGASYHWRVRSRAGARTVTHGDAVFRTLDAEQTARRRRLAQRADPGSDTSLLLLLAALDSRSGLAHEACGSLTSAARRHPDNAALERLQSHWACPARQ